MCCHVINMNGKVVRDSVSLSERKEVSFENSDAESLQWKHMRVGHDCELSRLKLTSKVANSELKWCTQGSQKVKIVLFAANRENVFSETRLDVDRKPREVLEQ